MLYLVPGTPVARLQDVTLPVALTEGEKKTLALEALSIHGMAEGGARFLPIGLAGAWNWRGSVDDVFDSDDPNRSGAVPAGTSSRANRSGFRLANMESRARVEFTHVVIYFRRTESTE